MSFTIKKIKSCGFTTINNSLIRNTELNYNERVALIVVMSLPETKPNGEPFEYSVKGFASILGVAYLTAQKILVSLDEKGYLHREWDRIGGTFKKMEYIFYEDNRVNPYYCENSMSDPRPVIEEDFTEYPAEQPYMKGYTILDNSTIRNTDLKPVERLVWWGGLSLPKYKNNGERFEINIDSLSKMLSLNHSTVQKSLSVLIQRGYVRRDRYRLENGGNKFLYEFYQCSSDEDAQKNLKPEEEGAQSPEKELSKNDKAVDYITVDYNAKTERQPNDNISKNDKTVDYITVDCITVDCIQKNIIDKENNNKRNNSIKNTEISNKAVLTNIEYREENENSVSISDSDSTALIKTMKSIICKTFNKNEDELNGIELKMIEEWERCGADEEMLELAISDSLYKRNFSVKDIDYRLMSWLKAGAEDVEDCQDMINEAHKKNLEEFKKRNPEGYICIDPGKAEAIREIENGNPHTGLLMLLATNASDYLSLTEVERYIIPYSKTEWEGKWIADKLIQKMESSSPA